MSNTQKLIDPALVEKFVQDYLINQAATIAEISKLVSNASDLAINAIFDSFSCNVHFGISDIKKFNIDELDHTEPRNRIMQSLHKKVWYAFHDLIEKHLSPATAEHFKQFYLLKDRFKGFGAPNLEGINKALLALEDVEQCAKELQDLKPLLTEVTGGELEEKTKLKNGTLEQKALLIAKLANLRIRLNNIAQPVHYAKDPEISVDEIYSKVLALKASSTGEDVEVIPKVLVKFFANGNIDLKYYQGYASTILNNAL